MSLGGPVGQDQREQAKDGQGKEVAPHGHNMEGGRLRPLAPPGSGEPADPALAPEPSAV